MPGCRHKMANGGKCKARPRQESGLCFAHDPALAEERAAANKRGGEASAALRAEKEELQKLLSGCKTLDPSEPDIGLQGEADIRALMAATINQVRKGKLSPKVAQVIAQCSNVALKSIEQGDLDRRMDGLEKLVRPFEGLDTEKMLAALKAVPNGAPDA